MTRATSWVIVRRSDGTAIAETWLPRVAAAVNTAKYDAIPAGDYLTALNRRLKAEAIAAGAWRGGPAMGVRA